MVDRNRLVRQFASLVAIDAESFHERTMADYVTRRLRELGLTVTEDHASPKIQENCGVTSEDGSGNLHAVLEATAPGKPILFGAHLDTVSPGSGKRQSSTRTAPLPPTARRCWAQTTPLQWLSFWRR